MSSEAPEVVEIIFPHDPKRCYCNDRSACYRYSKSVPFLVRGITYWTTAPRCCIGDFVHADQADHTNLAELLSDRLGLHILSHYGLESDLGCRFWPHDLRSILDHLTPCWQSVCGRDRYFLKEDMLDLLVRLGVTAACYVCGGKVTGLNSEAIAVLPPLLIDVPDEDRWDLDEFHWGVQVCGARCREALLNINRTVATVFGAMVEDRAIKKETERCQRQMKVMRKFLRSGDPEVLRSHLRESRPRGSSPS